jgi:hypothetical protein
MRSVLICTARQVALDCEIKGDRQDMQYAWERKELHIKMLVGKPEEKGQLG